VAVPCGRCFGMSRWRLTVLSEAARQKQDDQDEYHQPNPPLGYYPNRCDKARSERGDEQHNQNDGKICFISDALLWPCPFTEGALQSAIADLRCSGSGGLARMARQEDARLHTTSSLTARW